VQTLNLQTSICDLSVSW